MFSEFGKNTLAPLVLRVGLAVILIYSGYEMVFGPPGKDPEWGTRWADLMYEDPQPRITYQQQPKEKLPTDSKEGAPQRKDKAQPPAKREKTSEQPTSRPMFTLEQRPVPDRLQDKYVQGVIAWGILLGGIALAIGLLTPLAALVIIIFQLGAIYTVNFERASLSPGGFGPVGLEYNVSIIIACLGLIFLGGGEFAVDQYLFRRKAKPKA